MIVGPGMISSRFPIVRVGTTRAAPLPDRDESWRTEGFGGSVTFVEIDASARFPALGRPVVIWLVDAPSDPSLHRPAVMARLRAAVDGWAGRALVANAMGAGYVKGRTRLPVPQGWWGIDLAFVGPAFRAVWYDTVSPPFKAMHALQVVDLVPSARAAGNDRP